MYRAHPRVAVVVRVGGLRTETAVNPTGGPWVLSPMKIHVSPFV